MEIAQQFFTQTPIWVWIILVWLVSRGIRSRRPGTTTLLKMAIIPLLFTGWGIFDLATIYGVKPETVGTWLVGIAAGAVVGWYIASRSSIVADRAAGVLHRPADYWLLPLLLVTFAVKYVFGVIGAVSPDLLTETGFRLFDLILSGFFTGIFVGKFIRYASIWRAAGVPATQAGS